MTKKKPNILLLIADQHRWDCLGRSNCFPVSTPNLDRLADQGAFFQHAFTPTPVCAPARQALISGLAPESFGALWNPDFIETATVKPDEHFYTAALSGSGYDCTLIGKWNTSLNHSPADFGFNNHISWQEHSKLIAAKYPELNWQRGWFGEASPIELEDSKTHWAAGQACQAMSRAVDQSKPWFVRVDFSDPHLPCRPSSPFASMFNPADIQPWSSFPDPLEYKPYIQKQQVKNWQLEHFTWADWQQTAALYYGMIAQQDDAIGQILSHLDILEQQSETLVVFTSDHGDLCGGHGMIDKHYVLYDDVTRVPLIVRYPDEVAAGLRIEAFVSSALDFAGTVADFCQLDQVSRGHGRSWAPLLGEENQPGRDFAVSSGHGQQFGLYCQRSIRTRDWLYVWNLTDIDELYSVNDDPGQIDNRIDSPELGDVLRHLRRQLHRELVRRQDPFITSGWLDQQLLS